MTDWTDAACRPYVRAGADYWHKPTGSGQAHPAAEEARIRHAKAICSACPVKAACLAAATSDDQGVWGGMTRGERRGRPAPKPKPKRKPRTPAACGTEAAYRRHRRAGEPTCDACREAQRLVSRRSRAKRAKGAA